MMQKIIAVLILGLFSIGEFYGQDFKKVQFQVDFGTTLTLPYIKSIETLPHFDRNPQTDYGSDFGYFFEILMSYNFNSNYAISTGLNYNYLSLKITDKAGFIENKGELTNSYLTFPVFIT
ncbi:MAG: outer membrane beta-barrel protein, partial [Salinivirgaceae bacterium]